MALSVNEVDTVSTKYFDPMIKQHVYDRIDFLKQLRDKEKVRISGGTSITWPVRYDTLDHADVVAWNDSIDFEATPTRTQAELEWIPYRSQTLLTWKERTYNAAGKTRIVNLMEDKAKELEQDMLDRLATDIWATSTTSGHMISLADIVDESTTYAGIATTDASNWAGYEDTSTTKMTLLFLYESIAEAQWGSDGPTRHYTTRNLLANYASLLSSNERWVDKAARDSGTFKLSILGNQDVVADPYVPSGDWYGLDLNQFELWVQKDNDFDISGWRELWPDYAKSLGKIVTMVCNLVCRNRRTSFKLTALTGT